MQDIWKKLLAGASDLLPNFNDELLLNFRQRKIHQIRNYLNDLFSESVKMFDGRLKYIGWRELSPDERIEYIKNNAITKNKPENHNLSWLLENFIFFSIQ